jgi:Ca2+:H+ antiporter
MKSFLKKEFSLIPGIITVIIFIPLGTEMLSDLSNPMYTTFYFLWLFAIMLWASFNVVRHADMLALRLGEPYGTLILTLAVISIEVIMISTIMLTGTNNPTLGRDMMFSVIMIVLNGLVGVALIAGGLRHKEQTFNFKSANTYLTVLIPLAAIGLILPNYTRTTEIGTFSNSQAIFLIAITLFLYLAFLIAQTSRHKEYFVFEGETTEEEHGHDQPKSIIYHVIFLIIHMLIIVLLSKKLAIIIDYSILSLEVPVALGGVLVAILVLSPEGMAAIQAAKTNNLQRSVNITLGSAIATIGLTVPAVLLISRLTGNQIILGLESAESFLLVLTFLISIVNFSSGRSNMLQGLVHLILFMVYLILVFD